MQKIATSQGQFNALTIGLIAGAALLAAAALAVSHGQMPHYPSDVPPPATLLSPTTLSRIIEVCSNGLRYRHWAAGALAKWHAVLSSRSGV